MAVRWYIDEGLTVLKRAWLTLFPNAVVYSVGDASHLEEGNKSQHNPEAAGSLPGQDAGEVDALDFMIGYGVGATDLQKLFDDLREGRDPRIFYIIHNRKIVSSVTQPWVVRPYTGSDPHTDHVHLSVNDKFDNNQSEWKMGDDDVDQADANQIATAVVAKLRTTAEDLSDTERIYIGKQVDAQLAPRFAAILSAVQGIDVTAEFDPQTLAGLARDIADALPDDLAENLLDRLAERLKRTVQQ